MKKGLYKKCLTCHVEFYVYPYLLNTRQAKYCSLGCGRKGEYRKCILCQRDFYALPGQVKRGWGKYCSHSCSSKSRNATAHLGSYAEKGTPAPKTAFKRARVAFKGTLAEYKALHHWVNIQLGKPNKCSHCGRVATGRQIDWANISGNYLKDVTDWIRLCKKCHFYYDNQQRRMLS